MTDLGSTEQYPTLPIFLVIDVSGSMGPPQGGTSEQAPIEAVNRALPELRDAIRNDPESGEVARIGLITFSDDASCEMPLSDLGFAEFPRLNAGGMTNFAAAFRTLRAELETGIRELGKGAQFIRPVAFFMSDGHNNPPRHLSEDWIAPLEELRDPKWKFRPEIVAFGFGQANEGELGRIATKFAFMAKAGLDPRSAAREVLDEVRQSIRVLSSSTIAGSPELQVDPPSNKWRPLPVLEVD